MADLCAPRWRMVKRADGGIIQVESKDEIRKRLGRSTDAGDAVVMAFWPERPGESHRAPYIARKLNLEHV